MSFQITVASRVVANRLLMRCNTDLITPLIKIVWLITLLDLGPAHLFNPLSPQHFSLHPSKHKHWSSWKICILRPKIFSTSSKMLTMALLSWLVDTLADSLFPRNHLCSSMTPAFLPINYHSVFIHSPGNIEHLV